MDTSETYARMRFRAIPSLGIGTAPDDEGLRWLRGSVYVDQLGNFFYAWWQVEKQNHIIFQLERQDQLQEMIEEKRPYFLLMELEIEANRGLGFDEGWTPYWRSFPSWEQLLLAFVYKQRYNKVWNGDDWVKVS